MGVPLTSPRPSDRLPIDQSWVQGGTTGKAGLAAATPAEGRQALEAAAATHTHSAADLTSGTVPAARLGTSGTRDATTVLYGDNTWKAAPTGGTASPAPVMGGVTAADAGVTLTTDGTGNNRAALNTLFTHAGTKKTYARLPEGFIAVSGGELTAPVDCRGVIGPGSGLCIIRSATNNHHGFRIIGTFAETHHRKRVEGFSIQGPIGAPPRNGFAAYVTDRCPQIVSRDIAVDGWDIGRDFLNNCYNSCDYDLFGKRTDQDARSLNVFIHLREGAQSGSDNHFYNPQGTGLVSALVMHGGGGGNFIYGGSIGTAGVPAAGDIDGNGNPYYGVVTVGRNYVTGQAAPGVGNIGLHGLHIEGYRGRPLLRTYGDLSIHFGDLGTTASAGNGGSTGPASEMATRLIHSTDGGNAKITFSYLNMGQCYFSSPDVILVDGTVNDGFELAFPGRRLNSGSVVAGVGQFDDWFTTGWDVANGRDGNYVSGHAFIHPNGKAGLQMGRLKLLTDQGQQLFLQQFANGPLTALNPAKEIYHPGGNMQVNDYEPNTCIFFDNAADATFTVPSNFMHGAKGMIVQLAAGKMRVVGVSGQTFPRGSTVTVGPGSVLRWEKVGNNVICQVSAST